MGYPEQEDRDYVPNVKSLAASTIKGESWTLPNIELGVMRALDELAATREILTSIEEPLGMWQGEKTLAEADTPMPSAALERLGSLVTLLRRDNDRIRERMYAIKEKIYG